MIIFQSLLLDEQVANAPVLILGNKIDTPAAVSEDELRSVFRIRSTGKVSHQRSQTSASTVT